MLLENERKKVIEIALKVKEEKLIPLTFGNFSLRDPGTGYICITPSGMPYEALHPSDIVVVDENNQKIDGERRPSIETPLHTAMYRKRPDVNGVVHTHSSYCTAWACRDGGMPCITSEAAELVGGRIELAAFVPPGSEELAEVTSDALGQDKVVLMGNHGVICVDETIEKAFQNAIIAEESAKVAYFAYQMGNVNTLEEQMIEFLKKDADENYGQK
ncbi:MAG: class II aldolase/adducin family protein [Anaerostipes sp.]|uniref:class II aldolase/adducin family protein n=1 Tax=Anaerostipes sp. TaxID=1872530 RepID=UPI0039920574